MGLLAKATELLEQADYVERKAVADAITGILQPTMTTSPAKSNAKKLRRLVACFSVGLALQFTTPTCKTDLAINNNYKKLFTHKEQNKDAVIEQSIQKFSEGLESRVSQNEREILARMLYGEAGRGADPFEILHTVLNRVSSPLFKGSITDIVTQKNQYLGYNPKNPLTKDYLTMVDMVIDEWEANGCQKIEGCNHYYFVTGTPGICNKFEISPANSQGRWVPTSAKKYAKKQHYCDVATKQAKNYFANRKVYQRAYGHEK